MMTLASRVSVGGEGMAHEEAPRAGRPQSVSTERMLAEARRLVSEVGVADFSVRELAKALGLVPGTIHARFGNKHELLALLYLQRIAATQSILDELPPDSLNDVSAFLSAMSPHLSTLRREFALHFDGDGNTQPRLDTTTWTALKVSFSSLVDRVYECFRESAANEGVQIIGGSLARRLVWNATSTMDNARSAMAFDHTDARYRQFVTRSLLAALSVDEQRKR